MRIACERKTKKTAFLYLRDGEANGSGGALSGSTPRAGGGTLQHFKDYLKEQRLSSHEEVLQHLNSTVMEKANYPFNCG